MNKKIVLLILFFALFSYFRLKPIYLQTVPYTFDQGSDFLKTIEIVRDRNLTLIGPTTGAAGVFHGAWWYYYLSIPHILFQGHPLGYYVFIYLTLLVQVILFYVFLDEKFHPHIALFFLMLMIASPYFITTSIFAINSILTLPFILLFFYSVYSYLEKNRLKYLLGVTISIGMILEAELAFGVFLVPAFLLTLISIRKLKYFFGSKNKLILGVFGFLLAIFPRILFELKNDFFQTRSILNFSKNPGTNPVTLQGAILDRLRLFKDFYIQIFPQGNELIGYSIGLLAIVGLVLGYKKLKNIHQRFFMFITIILGWLFLISLLYRNNFFWANYLEGLPYFFIILVLFGLFGLSKSSIPFARKILLLLSSLFIMMSVYLIQSDIVKNEEVPTIGLRMQSTAIAYIYNRVGQNKFCLKIYTPPVLTYTYDYIIDYYVTHKGVKNPQSTFIKHRCWYIIERDDYAERLAKWRTDQIPEKSAMIESRKISKDATVELWEIKTK